jgi:hypothetical protein
MVFKRGVIFVDFSSDSNFEKSIMPMYKFEELDGN